MQIVLAEHAGACYGVQRALDLALETAEKESCTCTLGPLIHNPQVVRQLEGKGVSVASSVDDITPDSTVIIRSHGVTPEVIEELEARGLPYVDATCPHVARAQTAAYDLAAAGCLVVVVGEEGHPEVQGLVAYAKKAGAKVFVVLSPDEIPADVYEPVGVVAQTTQTLENFQAVVDELCSRGFEPVVKRTVCSATRKRQDTAAALGAKCDAIVVIGGRNSSNTTRLAEICALECEKTFHIELPDELAPAMFEGCEIVGVTAGASTPESQISEVIRRLESF